MGEWAIYFIFFKYQLYFILAVLYILWDLSSLTWD